MPRKAKRRFFRPRRPQQRTEDAAHDQQRLEAAARSLLDSRSAEQLSQDVSEREFLLADADRVAQLDPNPVNLSRYRFALSQLEVAQRALALLTSKPTVKLG
jgi:hypothetical protein